MRCLEDDGNLTSAYIAHCTFVCADSRRKQEKIIRKGKYGREDGRQKGSNKRDQAIRGKNEIKKSAVKTMTIERQGEE